MSEMSSKSSHIIFLREETTCKLVSSVVSVKTELLEMAFVSPTKQAAPSSLSEDMNHKSAELLGTWGHDSLTKDCFNSAIRQCRDSYQVSMPHFYLVLTVP